MSRQRVQYFENVYQTKKLPPLPEPDNGGANEKESGIKKTKNLLRDPTMPDFDPHCYDKAKLNARIDKDEIKGKYRSWEEIVEKGKTQEEFKQREQQFREEMIKTAESNRTKSKLPLCDGTNIVGSYIKTDNNIEITCRRKNIDRNRMSRIQRDE